MCPLPFCYGRARSLSLSLTLGIAVFTICWPSHATESMHLRSCRRRSYGIEDHLYLSSPFDASSIATLGPFGLHPATPCASKLTLTEAKLKPVVAVTACTMLEGESTFRPGPASENLQRALVKSTNPGPKDTESASMLDSPDSRSFHPWCTRPRSP